MALKTLIFENIEDAEKRHTVLSAALREHTGIDSAEIVYNAKGRPSIKGLDEELYMSVTTCGEVMICVFAPTPVGIDGEYLARFNTPNKIDYTALAEHFFSEEEAEYVRDGDGDPLRFVKIWTRKEAYIKYTGKSMTEFTNFTVSDGERFLNKVFSVPIKKFTPVFPGAIDYFFAIAGDFDV